MPAWPRRENRNRPPAGRAHRRAELRPKRRSRLRLLALTGPPPHGTASEETASKLWTAARRNLRRARTLSASLPPSPGSEAETGGGGDIWGGPPEPFEAVAEAPQPFPVTSLGPLLAPAAEGIAAHVNCPVTMACSSVLSAASLATQHLADVSLHPIGRRPVGLAFMTRARSGERKTAANRRAFSAIKDWQRGQAIEHKSRLKEYEIKREVYEKAKANILKGAGGKNPIGQEALEADLRALNEPVRPREQRVMMADPSVEAIKRSMVLARPSLGLIADDSAELLGGHAFGKDHKLKTLGGAQQASRRRPFPTEIESVTTFRPSPAADPAHRAPLRATGRFRRPDRRSNGEKPRTYCSISRL